MVRPYVSMKPRLLLLLSCWLLVLAAPPLRDQFLTQVKPGHFYRGWAYGPFANWLSYGELPELPADLPRDARLQAVALEERENGAGKFGRDYDALIKQYPGEAWLLARRLSKSLSEMSDDRVGGELSDGNLQANKAAGKPSPERDPKNLNFKPNELEEVIALARRGQKLEPDNAFFDWMLVYFLMSGWRDREAWPVLAQAAKKPRFDEYEGDWAKANIYARQWQLRRPLLLEEALILHSNIGNAAELSYFSRLREMARIIVWEANKAERRGNHAKALEIHTNFARVAYSAARHSRSYVGSMSYKAIGDLALLNEGKRPKVKPIPDNDPHIVEKIARLRADYFSRYARAHGRADLAQEMTALRLATARDIDSCRNAFHRPDISNGVAVRPLRWAVILWCTAMLLLLILPMLALWYLLLGAALHFARVPKVPVEKRHALWATILAAGAPSLCWAAGFYGGAGWLWPLYLVSGSWDESYGWMMPSMGSMLFGLGLAAPVAALAAKRLSREAAPRLTVRGRVRQFIADFRLSALLRNAIVALLLLAASVWWLGSVFRMSDFPTVLSAACEVFPLWPQLAFFVAISLMWLPLFFAPAARKPTAARRLRLLHAALGNLAVAASVSYLLLLLISLPVRGTANAQVAQLIERGERALLLQNAPR